MPSSRRFSSTGASGASANDASALGELNELLWALPISLDPAEIAAALLERGARMFRSPLAGLWVTVDGDPELVGTFGLTDKKAEQLWSALGLSDTAPEPLNLCGEGLSRIGAFGKRRLGALLATPLRLPTGLLGWLVFARLEGEAYSDFEEQLVGIISNRVAFALDNARLYSQTATRSQELALLTEVSSLLISTMQLEDLLQAIVQRVVEVFDVTTASIQLLDPESGTLPTTAAFHRDAANRTRVGDFLEAKPLRSDSSLTGQIFATGKYYLTPNLAEDPIVNPDLRDLLGVGSCLALPLIVRGSIIGGMYWFKAGRVAPLDERIVPLAIQLAGQIAMAIENARLYQALERQVNERDARLQSVHEELASRMNGGRQYFVQLREDLRQDLDIIADSAAKAGSNPAAAAAIARMVSRLDDLEARLAEGQQRPF